MKIQISAEGLRVRLTYRELEQVQVTPVMLVCGSFSWMLRVDERAESCLEGWPAQGVLILGRRDFSDLRAEPENGIVLTGVSPRIILEVDKRDGR